MVGIDHARDSIFAAKLLVLRVIDTRLPDSSLGPVGKLTTLSFELDPTVDREGVTARLGVEAARTMFGR